MLKIKLNNFFVISKNWVLCFATPNTYDVVSDMGKYFLSPYEKSMKDLAKKLEISPEQTYFTVDKSKNILFL